MFTIILAFLDAIYPIDFAGAYFGTVIVDCCMWNVISHVFVKNQTPEQDYTKGVDNENHRNKITAP